MSTTLFQLLFSLSRLSASSFPTSFSSSSIAGEWNKIKQQSNGILIMSTMPYVKSLKLSPFSSASSSSAFSIVVSLILSPFLSPIEIVLMSSQSQLSLL